MLQLFKKRGDETGLTYQHGNFYHNGIWIGKWPLSNFKQLLSRFRLLNRLLRLEPRLAIALTDEDYLVAFQRQLGRLNIKEKRIVETIPSRLGFSTPLNICSIQQDNGPVAYWGDYGKDEEKKEKYIYRYTIKDGAKICYTFPAGYINHIHNILYDKWRNQFVILTGDFGEKVGIYIANHDFSAVTPFLIGSEDYRACQAVVMEKGLLWTTDAALIENHVFYADFNQPKQIQKLSSLNGSVINGMEINDGLLFSTTVECPPSFDKKFTYFSNKIAPGIKSREVYLIFVSKNLELKTIKIFKKDIFFIRLFQYGQVKFPIYEDKTEKEVWVYPVAVKGHDGKPFLIGL